MKKILMVYVEPTPYIVGLIEKITLIFKGTIDVLFLGENHSQEWNIDFDQQWTLIPKNRLKKIYFLLHLLLTKKYDMVHLAGWWEPDILFLIFLSKFFSIPITIESDTPQPYGTKLWKRVLKRLIYPRLFSFASLFLPGGTRQAKYIEYYGVNSERIISVQMTVDVTRIKKYAETLSLEIRQKMREVYSISNKDILFLFVGRLVEHKGVGDLIEIFNRMSNAYVKLLFVGDGPMRQQVEESVKLNNRICYAGRVSGNDLIKIYYSADVLVLPSYTDPWGLVVNEAMALGLPVIVSDKVGCIDDLVVNQKSGLIVQSGSTLELQKAIEELSIASDKRVNMSKEAIKIIEKWTLENEAKNVCQAWDKVIS